MPRKRAAAARADASRLGLPTPPSVRALMEGVTSSNRSMRTGLSLEGGACAEKPRANSTRSSADRSGSGLAHEKNATQSAALACRQIGPVSFKGKFKQGEDVYRKRRSLFFKKMQIVRGCDAKRNVLVYLVYSDRIIEGSPQNSTSTVPIMPWGNSPAPRCNEFLEK